MRTGARLRASIRGRAPVTASLWANDKLLIKSSLRHPAPFDLPKFSQHGIPRKKNY
ncbi:hypothetical protein [Paenirhodobacter sp.]|uniref:hypothetical protein n=1 Tax=Paenirhodobacter sp. TaxID=1965326 RepID=UPI003B3D3AD9